MHGRPRPIALLLALLRCLWPRIADAPKAPRLIRRGPLTQPAIRAQFETLLGSIGACLFFVPSVGHRVAQRLREFVRTRSTFRCRPKMNRACPA